MQNTKQLDLTSMNPIWNEVRVSPDREFACPCHPADSTALRMGDERLHLREDLLRDSSGSSRTLARDVVVDLSQIGYR